MSFGELRHPEMDAIPNVGRPRGAAWRALQADGVVWEGQVVLVGGESDLASRMIVTARRVAFARGGLVVLDLTRDWLRPAPILRRDGIVQVSITPPGQSYDVTPETILIRMRDGYSAAGHVIAMLAGSGARLIAPEAMSSQEYVRGILPPLTSPRRSAALDRFETEAPAPDFPRLAAGYDDDPDYGEFGLLQPSPHLAGLPPLGPSVLPELAPGPTAAAPTPTPEHPRLVRHLSTTALATNRQWNLPAAETIAPRGVRRRRTWIFRIGGLVVLAGIVGGSALLGAGRLPLPTFGPALAPGESIATGTVAALASNPNPTVSEGFVSTVMADSTAFVLGIGAEGAVTPTAPPLLPAVAQATVTPVPTIGPPAASDGTSTSVAPGAGASPAATPAATSATSPAGNATATSSVSGLAVEIETADLGGTLPKFSLVAPAEGAWLAIRLTVTNPSASEVELALEDFQLSADGTDYTPDRKSLVVASVLRLNGAPEALDEAIRLDPGDDQSLALVFNVPPAVANLTLRLGDESIPLSPSIASLRQGYAVQGFSARVAPLPAMRPEPVTLFQQPE